MTSILVSSDNQSVSKQIAEAVSKTLEYTYVGDDLILDQVGKNRLSRDDLDRLFGEEARPQIPSGRLLKRLVALQTALSERLLGDNVVVDGLGAHLHVRGVSHVLTVRVLSDMRSQAHHLAVDKRISPRSARKLLEKQARHIQQWSLSTFGVDETSPATYDMVLTLGTIDADRAVTTIVDMAKDRKFQPMTYSLKCLENLALADRVRAGLIADYPGVDVVAEDGLVRLRLAKRWFGWQRVVESLRARVGKVDGVEGVEIYTSALPIRGPTTDMTGT